MHPQLKISSVEDFVNGNPTIASRAASAQAIDRFTEKGFNSYNFKNIFLLGPWGMPTTQVGEVIDGLFIYGKIEERIAESFPQGLNTLQYSRIDGQWMPLYGDCGTNIWHWIIEKLPLVMVAEIEGYRGGYIVPALSFAVESMSLIGIPAERILVHGGQNLSVEETIIPQPFPGWKIDYNRWVLDLIREKILGGMSKLKVPSSAQRVYLSRKKASQRRVLNEDELMQMLSKYGFEAVNMEDYSFTQQVALATNVEALVGPHGAGFVHSLFFKPQSLVIELFSPKYINPCMLGTMDFLQHRYFMIPSFIHVGEYQHDQDIQAFIAAVEVTLKRELAGRGV